MRRHQLFLVAFLALTAACSLNRPPDEIRTKTLHESLDPSGSGRFKVENLAGEMRLIPGEGDSVEIVATVHAQGADLLEQVRFETLEGEEGETILRLEYPLEEHPVIRYPQGEARDTGVNWLNLVGGGDSSVGSRYAGRKVRVSDSDGPLLYADLEIRVPPGVSGSFHTLVGSVEGVDLEGDLGFQVTVGTLILERVSGALTMKTISGDLVGRALEGSLACSLTSGEVEIEGFVGESLACSSISGDVVLRGVSAADVAASTTSGDVHVYADKAGSITGKTVTGEIMVAAASGPLEEANLETTSGDVELFLGPDASFEALVSLGRGEVSLGYEDVEPIEREGEVVGYRRGSGESRISVSTGRGDLIIAPGQAP